MKGHKQSEKQKKIVSKCSSDYMNRPEIKEKYSKISSEYHNRPEVKEKTETIAYRLKCAKTANGLSHFVMYGDVSKKKTLL